MSGSIMKERMMKRIDMGGAALGIAAALLLLAGCNTERKTAGAAGTVYEPVEISALAGAAWRQRAGGLDYAPGPGEAWRKNIPAVAPDGEGREPVVDRDIVIPMAELSSTAQFYPALVDGVLMEILAVKAPDGSYRTAFNTCQVCYGSGRGYYVQRGNVLVCQNCGNRFRLSQVEVRSGGCNPVPIFPANKVVGEDTITISLEYLRKAKDIFARWRRS
jgi:hypothetical protein